MREATIRGDLTVLAVTLALAAGCGPRDGARVEESVNGSGDLAATLEVETSEEAVRFTLHVTNTTTEAIELEFRTGQRYDFTVARLDGEELWRWSSDRMFTQALGTEIVPQGGSLRYTEEWRPAGRTGEFVATGRLTAANREVSQSARFELGGGR